MGFVIRIRENVFSGLLVASVAALSGCQGQPAADNPAPTTASPPPGSASPPTAMAASPKPAPATSSAPVPAVSRLGNFAAALSQPDKEPADKSLAAKPSKGQQPISDAEAQEFVSAFDKALTAGDAKALEEAFDEEAMIGKAVGALALPPATGASFIRGSVQGARQGQGEGDHFASRVAKGGKYHLLHVRKHGKWQCALFRYFDSLGHMNYIEFILARDSADKVRINDYYDYGFAELHTLELQRAIMCKLVEDRAETADLNPGVIEYSKHKDEIESMERLIYDKKFSDAIEIYEKLPETLQKSRIGLILRVSACHKEKDKCDDLVHLFREKFPNDSGLDLFIGQYQSVLRRWDEALAGIDTLDKQLGGDPYLNAERAAVELSKGNLSAAKKLLQKSVSAGPEGELVRDLQKQIAELEKKLGSDVSAAEEPPGKAASDDEAQTFVAQLVKCVMASDAEGIQKCIDVGSFYRRATAALDIPAEIKLGLEAQFRSGNGAHIADYFHLEKDQIEKGATFSLLRLHTRKGEQRAVFRLIFPDGGISHSDCVLEKYADGKVRIADYYDLHDGGMRSELYGLLLLDAVKDYKPSSDEGPPRQPTNEPSVPRTIGSAWHEMHTRVIQGSYQDALDVYNKLPADLQKEKRILLTRVHAASHLKGAPYDSAIHDYCTAFPKEPNVDLLLFEANLEHKLYDRALANIDSLDRKIGGDPYLDVLRCEAHLLMKDLNAARRFARKAVDADPHIFRAYKWLLDISLRQKKFAETSALLTSVQKFFPHCMPNVQSDAEYRDYIKSPQFRSWVKKQNDKP